MTGKDVHIIGENNCFLWFKQFIWIKLQIKDAVQQAETAVLPREQI